MPEIKHNRQIQERPYASFREMHFAEYPKQSEEVEHRIYENDESYEGNSRTFIRGRTKKSAE